MNKTELLAKVTQSRAEFETLIAQFSDEQMLQPVLPGGWTIKDALAHIAWWARRGYIVVTAVSDGLEPAYSLDESDVDKVNRNTYETNLMRPLDEVRREEVESYQTLLALVENLPNDDLSDPTKYAWTKGKPLSVVVEWNTFAHYDEHMPDLRRVLMQ